MRGYVNSVISGQTSATTTHFQIQREGPGFRSGFVIHSDLGFENGGYVMEPRICTTMSRTGWHGSKHCLPRTQLSNSPSERQPSASVFSEPCRMI